MLWSQGGSRRGRNGPVKRWETVEESLSLTVMTILEREANV